MHRAEPDNAGGGRDMTCANCGAALVGRYCHACGQRAEPEKLTLRTFLTAAAADVFSTDSRLYKSFRSLLFRPGILTREFVAGHRVQYTRPLQLYLLAAGLFFLVCNYRPMITFDPETRVVESALTAISASGELEDDEVARLAARGISVDLFAERFRISVNSYLPTFLIGSVLIFALSLALLYRRNDRGFLEHVVFALHWAAFYFLLMSVVQLAPGSRREISPARFAEMASFVVAWVYLFLALRRVYTQSVVVTLAKSTLLMFWFTTLLALWIISVIAWSMAQI